MRHHGRIDRRKIGKRLGIIQLDHGVNSRTAGSDKVFILAPFQQFFVLRRHFARAHARLFRVRKAQPAESEFHDGKILQVERGDKGRRDGRDDVAAL